MKTQITLLATVLVLSTLLSSCFYSGGYRHRPDYYGYGPRYAPRPYVRVPPPVIIRPRIYVTPPRYNARPRYDSRYRRGNSGRRRW